ncbi:hypothetical protein GCM10009122_17730 [Fulvivirga kasyanovii]|uniref:PepSY domain-containing protein n=1 Tax=Fulvivirga kasyanovii TaxID=396812 RepID=A0ABW9RXP4_9BACT|nr:hypothetical protein [Fulvivirga kasyanovii]MTI28801.1 hypothetical protein [Fulvivirga kasyanovii]
MKTLIRTIAASMIIAGTAAFSTNAVAQVEQQDKMEQKQDEKVEIRMTEVPSPVSEAISSDYADWKASKVYKVTDPKSRKTVYEVHFTSPQGVTEKKKFSAEGEEIDG